MVHFFQTLFFYPILLRILKDKSCNSFFFFAVIEMSVSTHSVSVETEWGRVGERMGGERRRWDFQCVDPKRIHSFPSRRRATSTRATAATSPTSASPTVTPTCSRWAGRTPASSSGRWSEARQATAGRDWPRPHPPPPALQNPPPARRGAVYEGWQRGSRSHEDRETRRSVDSGRGCRLGSASALPLLCPVSCTTCRGISCRGSSHIHFPLTHLRINVNSCETEQWDAFQCTDYLSFCWIFGEDRGEVVVCVRWYRTWPLQFRVYCQFLDTCT